MQKPTQKVDVVTTAGDVVLDRPGTFEAEGFLGSTNGTVTAGLRVECHSPEVRCRKLQPLVWTYVPDLEPVR